MANGAHGLSSTAGRHKGERSLQFLALGRRLQSGSHEPHAEPQMEPHHACHDDITWRSSQVNSNAYDHDGYTDIPYNCSAMIPTLCA